jgi:O-antigen/teichoic acid export membrane protein
LALSGYFANMGISSAVVQKPDLDDRDIRVAFTGTVALGLIMTAAVELLAPVIGQLFGNPGVVPVLRALALSFAITSFGSVSVGLMRRKMQFRQLAIVEIASYTLAYPLVGLLLAWLGAGVWSLVGAALTRAVAMVLLALTLAPHSLMPLIDGGRARRIYGFGGLVTVTSLLEFAGANADTFAVGRFIGAESLGQYNRATLVIGLPLNHLATGASKVLMPGFAEIQFDDERTRSVFMRALAVFASVILPLAAVLAVLARPLVQVLLGPQWSEAALVIPIVGAATAVGFVQHLPAVVCEARGRMHQKILIQCGYLTVVVALVLLVVQRGPTLLTLSLVFLAGQVLQEVLYMTYIKRDLSLSGAALLIIHGEALALAAACAVGAWAISSLVASPLLSLMAGSFAGAIIWIATVFLVKGLRVRAALTELNLANRFTWLRGQDGNKGPRR